jgi:hypothetical protein
VLSAAGRQVLALLQEDMEAAETFLQNEKAGATRKAYSLSFWS